MISDERAELTTRIDKIEAGYEYMLAYAARGYEAGSNSDRDQDIREFLNDLDQALTGISEVIKTVATKKNGNDVENYRSFIDVIETDSKKAKGVIKLVLTQPSVSSQLIDNLNASIHLRTLLTDLFVVDEALR